MRKRNKFAPQSKHKPGDRLIRLVWWLRKKSSMKIALVAFVAMCITTAAFVKDKLSFWPTFATVLALGAVILFCAVAEAQRQEAESWKDHYTGRHKSE